jgi:hypothetical protein
MASVRLGETAEVLAAAGDFDLILMPKRERIYRAG